MKSHLESLIFRKEELDKAKAIVELPVKLDAVTVTETLRLGSATRKKSAIERKKTILEESIAMTLLSERSVLRVEKVEIKVRIIFLKMGEIDTMRDRFAADVFIQAKWQEPALKGCTGQDPKKINWDRYWNPKLMVENTYGDTKETKWRTVIYDKSSGDATVVEKRRINGAFMEYMELNHFPFDIQDLTATLTTERDVNEIEFVEEKREPSVVNIDSFVDEQEWLLYKYVGVWTGTSQDNNKKNKLPSPTFSAACKASRRPGFFIWNILLVMFMICSMSLCTFAVASTQPQSRLQLSFILLLTNVSFKFVVNQGLPMISYLTILDKYILSSMGILCLVCVWHAMVAKMIYECQTNNLPPYNTDSYCSRSGSTIATGDSLALAVMASVYLMFHVIFILVINSLLKSHAQYAEKNQDMETDGFDDCGIIPDLFEVDSGNGNGSSNTAADDNINYSASSNVISAS